MLNVPSIIIFEMLANPHRSTFPFGPFIVYINESSTLVKTYGVQMRCYWEHLGEHISINKRTQKKKKSPPKKPKRKKLDPPQDMLSLLIGHMKNYGPKTVGHNFQPGVSPPTANGGESRVWVYI
jgi:hypothetical protein